MIAPSSASAPAAAIHRIDPDTLCLACLHEQGAPGGCAACGFDERAAVSSPLHLPPRTILHGQYLSVARWGRAASGSPIWRGISRSRCRSRSRSSCRPTSPAARPRSCSVMPYGEDGAANFDLGLEAFEGEARTLARCNTLAGVVDVLNYFRENGTGYIVMHYLRGRTLREHLRARGSPLPYGEAAAIVRPVLRRCGKSTGSAWSTATSVPTTSTSATPAASACSISAPRATPCAIAARACRCSSRWATRPRNSIAAMARRDRGPTSTPRRRRSIAPLTGMTPQPSLDRLTLDQLRPPGALGVAMPRARRARADAGARRAGDPPLSHDRRIPATISLARRRDLHPRSRTAPPPDSGDARTRMRIATVGAARGVTSDRPRDAGETVSLAGARRRTPETAWHD